MLQNWESARRRARTALVLIGLGATVLGLGGCSWLHFGERDDAYDYRKAKPRQQPLEVPPDLSQLPKDERYTVPNADGTQTAAKPGSEANPASLAVAKAAPAAVASTAAPAGLVVVPAAVGARIVRDGSERWLAVDTAPEVAYATVRDVLVSQGYKIEVDDPAVGLLETAWSQTRPRLSDDGSRSLLNRLLGTMDTNGEQNRFRARIERTAANTAEITISHRSLVEVYASDRQDTTKWQAGPSDPGLEAILLQRIALRFVPGQPLAIASVSGNNAVPSGGGAATGAAAGATVAASGSATATPATTPLAPATVGSGTAAATTAAIAGAAAATAPAAQAVSARVHKVLAAGVTSLQLEDDVEHTWRRVGVALDRGGFTIEDRSRDKHIYAVRYLDPDYEASEREKRSWWDRMFNADAKIPEQQFQIAVSGTGAISTVEIHDKNGKPDAGTTARRIVDQLYEQLL